LAQKLSPNWDVRFKRPVVGDAADMMKPNECLVEFLAWKYPKANIKIKVIYMFQTFCAVML
jgi:hypothetical protein